MLKELLISINKSGFLSTKVLADELKISEPMVEEGVKQLLRLGYILKEETGDSCSTACGGCPFAKSCSKDIVTMYRITDKGNSIISLA